MQELKPTEVSDFIKYIGVRLNKPVMIRGRSGVGKSKLTIAAANDLDDVDTLNRLFDKAAGYKFIDEDGNEGWQSFTGCEICDVRLAQYESVDLRGFPGVNKLTNSTVWYPPSTLPFIGNALFPKDKVIILFLDELTSAAPAVFSVAYQLINERRIGEHILMPNVRIVCAGNREDDQGIVNRMPFPLNNRLDWCEAIVDKEDWSVWGAGVGIAPVIIAFINFKPTLLHTYDPKKAEKAVATPRSWEAAADIYVDHITPENIRWAGISGQIGAGPMTELRTFINIWQKVIPPAQIAADPNGIAVPQADDMRYATSVMISGSLSDDKLRAGLYTYLKRMPPEMIVLSWQLAGKRDGKLFHTPEFMDFTKRYRSVFSF